MSIKQIAVAAVAAFGLSLGAYSASAGPLNEASPPHAPSTFTLIGHGGGGHGGGGHGGGGHGGGGMHAGGMHMGGMHMGRVGGRGATAFYRGGRVGGRTASYHGRRGYWRGGRWYGGGWYGGGSCYANCLEAGYGPGYCSVYSYNFCY